MLPKPNDGFDWVQAAAGPALVCRPLAPYAAHLVTTRRWTLGGAGHDADAVGWAEVARALSVDPRNLVRAHQVHGAEVLIGRHGIPPNDSLPQADIIVSGDPALALAVQTADCVPLLIADPVTGAAAAAHAGWRGLAKGVPGRAVRALADAFGSRARDLIAMIGPSISAERYEVDGVVREAFGDRPHAAVELRRWFLPAPRPAHWQFDGWTSARDQLQAAGMAAEHIYSAGLCTATYPELCSYRRDGKGAGRMAAAIRPRGSAAG